MQPKKTVDRTTAVNQAKDRALKKNLSENAFQNAYDQLNKEQKKAVDAVEGPVMVIAGPGTGKTQVLGVRVANILKKTQA